MLPGRQGLGINLRVAAVDIGSNSILLTIAEVGSSKPIPLKIIFDEAHVTGLSKGLAQAASISENSQARSYKVLKHYADVLKTHEVSQFKVVATEALRRAKNGTEVRKKIEQIFSTSVEIISGNREAELSFWSVQKEFADRKQKKIIFDIGGASTELCYGSDEGIEQSISLKVGSVMLTEKFGLQKKGSAHPAKDYVMGLLRDVPWLHETDSTIGIGVAGTMTTLIAMEKKIKNYDRSLVHGCAISRGRVDHWLHEVISRDDIDRQSIVGLPTDRSDVFSGGIVILKSLVDFINWNEIYCMDSGVRFGLMYEMLGI
jgi:exopolyphosphatase/guanosine-5'-triphosphate,3'-diphosphate pyrophosphatase